MATPGPSATPAAAAPATGSLTHEQEILAKCAWTGLVERLAGERNTQAMQAERDRALDRLYVAEERAERRGTRAVRLRAERDQAQKELNDVRMELEEEMVKVGRLRGVLERRLRELRGVEGRLREHHETHVCKRKRPAVFVPGASVRVPRGPAAVQPATATRRSGRGVPRVNYRVLAGRG